MVKNMKILISYIFCTTGGVETAIKNRIRHLDRTKNQIDLLFFHDYGGRAIYEDMNCDVYIENDQQKIREIIECVKYDVVISIDTKEILDILYSMEYKGKIGLEVHTTYLQGLEYLQSLREDLIDFIIVPSQFQKELLCSNIKIKAPTYVLPNAVDTEEFTFKQSAFKAKKKILLWVGRLDQHKNWRRFIELAEKIHKQSEAYEFWIVGGLKAENSELKDFENALYNADLHRCLKWLPYVRYEKMANIYSWVGSSGGAYVITSRMESFGMTVLEAMACDCPVISNDVGALGELVINNETGLLIKMDDLTIEETKDRVMGFIHDQQNLGYCVKKAKEMVYGEFTSEKVGEGFIELLEGIIKKK